MASVNDIIVKIRVDGKEMDATFGELKGHLGDVERKGSKGGKSIGDTFSSIKAGYFAAAAALAGVAAGISHTIDRASTFQESNSKLLAVFDKMPDAARKVRDSLHDAYFLSYNDATALLGATGDVLQGMEMEQEAALKLSEATVQLAADRGSFVNADAKAIAKALTSAYVGEREALKTYGIVITEADVKQKLYERGQNKLTGAALKAAKAQITYALALKQSEKSIGDLERTQDSYANTLKRLGQATDDFSVQMGAVFLPLATKVLEWGTDLVDSIKPKVIAGVLFAVVEVLKTYAVAIYDELAGITNIIIGALTGDLDQMEKGFKQSTGAITDVFVDMWGNIGDAYDEGVSKVEKFMEGQAAASTKAAKTQMENEEKLSAAKLKELEKIKAARKEFQEQMWEDEEKLKEELREARIAENESILAEEEYKVDELFRMGEISKLDYITVLDARLAYAKIMYGKESLIVKKLELDKRKLQMQTFKDFLKSFDGMMQTFRGKSRALFNIAKGAAIAKAIVNTYEAVTTTLAAYPYPINLIPAAAVAVQGWAQVGGIKSQSYRKGGFTGFGDPNKTAGVVEHQEYVLNQRQTNAFRRSGLLSAIEADRTGTTAVNSTVPQRANIAKEVGRQVRNALDGLSLAIDIDADGVARLVETGNKNLNELNF